MASLHSCRRTKPCYGKPSDPITCITRREPACRRWPGKDMYGAVSPDPHPPPPPPHGIPPTPPVVWCGVLVGYGGLWVSVNPPRPPVVWWWVRGYSTTPPPCGVVWCGGGLWVSGLVFAPFPGVGFRVYGLHPQPPPVVWVVGLFRV